MKTFSNSIVLLFLLLSLGKTLLAEKHSKMLPAVCKDAESLLSLDIERELESEEREMKIRLLRQCPKKEAFARLLERLIITDDAFVRAAAWEVLENQLDSKSKDFLIHLYYTERLLLKEKKFLYIYLSRLVTPKDQAKAKDIFFQGISSHSFVIQNASLVGLGKIRAQEAFLIFKKILAKKDASPAQLLSALEGLWRLKNNQGLALIKALAFHANPWVQRKAIEILADTPGKLYQEALLEVYLKGPHPKNQALVFRQAHATIEKWRKITPEKEIFYTKKKALLYGAPNDRASVTGVLQKYSILYSDKKSQLYYRKKIPPKDRVFSGRYFFVKTSSGLSGWVHGGAVLHIRSPEL